MEKKRSIFFIFLLIISLFLVLVAFCMIFGFIKSNLIPESSDEQLNVEVSTENVILGVTENYGQEYIDKIIFLGED